MGNNTLERIRRVAGLSQRQAASLLHCTQPHVSYLENGERRVTPEMAKRVREALLPLAMENAQALISGLGQRVGDEQRPALEVVA